MLLLALLPACATGSASFKPTTNVHTQGRLGEPAAGYEVQHEGTRLAEVHVWSQGAYRSQNGEATIVHVAMSLRNVGATPLLFDCATVQLEAFDQAGAPLPEARLAAVDPPGSSQREVAPGVASDVDLYYTLPGERRPEELASLRLRWGLADASGGRYVQFTDFTRDVERTDGYVYAWRPIYGFYDPFWLVRTPRAVIIRHFPVRAVFVPRHHRRY